MNIGVGIIGNGGEFFIFMQIKFFECCVAWIFYSNTEILSFNNKIIKIKNFSHKLLWSYGIITCIYIKQLEA